LEQWQDAGSGQPGLHNGLSFQPEDFVSIRNQRVDLLETFPIVRTAAGQLLLFLIDFFFDVRENAENISIVHVSRIHSHKKSQFPERRNLFVR
jgi:hypothetical protein